MDMNNDFLRRSRIRVEVAERGLPDFRPVGYADMDAIRRFLRCSRSRTCDYTLGGIYMWTDYFKYEYCIADSTLFLKGVAENDVSREAFMMPVGSLPPAEAVGRVLCYCRERGVTPLFSAVPEERLAEIASASGAGAHVEELRDWADYLYRIEDLATLAGKAYSKKRNHVNRFMTDNPDWELEPLSADRLDETLVFLDYADRTAEKTDPVLAEYERRECEEVLRNFALYPFEGAILRGQNGKIAAFTVAETMGDTLYVHIEKMDHGVSGAGETINKLFAAEMLRRRPWLSYVNREEDAGDPGLRYAKESYHPSAMLRKFNVLPAPWC